jgi:hypothetical protein
MAVGIIILCRDAYRQKDNQQTPKETYAVFVLHT